MRICLDHMLSILIYLYHMYWRHVLIEPWMPPNHQRGLTQKTWCTEHVLMNWLVLPRLSSSKQLYMYATHWRQQWPMSLGIGWNFALDFGYRMNLCPYYNLTVSVGFSISSCLSPPVENLPSTLICRSREGNLQFDKYDTSCMVWLWTVYRSPVTIFFKLWFSNFLFLGLTHRTFFYLACRSPKIQRPTHASYLNKPTTCTKEE